MCSLKQKIVRNNDQLFMSKSLRKAIMKGSKFKNISIKKKTMKIGLRKRTKETIAHMF